MHRDRPGAVFIESAFSGVRAIAFPIGGVQDCR